ncbi:NUDIX domain-containing protein [Candidatus Acetothermia bacterium]|jgi:8-oxo-dGTP pyrophosphatase MutT (NUDIX family)|nr:NUDIX domain-containing protein [Candidatus Acetothermia bacterium]MCI2432456.1 NUDIX domain-containing protein [Candidatus Acetothermia bacterium]MCI2435998.1 NUDIX domain-containing protein [Candidatus Acetothermia bacterium]
MTERSAGVIVFRNGAAGREYLLLRSASGGHWSFPKGRVEPDEDDLTTALRELREETNLDNVEIQPDFKAVLSYDFPRGSASFSKEVVYFLGRATSFEVKLSGEHLDCLWASYARARQRLSFENTQEVLEQAEKFLDHLALSS